jgi:hypothetical protein
MPRAPTTEEATKNAKNRPRSGGGAGGPSAGTVTGNVPRPSTRYTAYDEGNMFRVSVPSNWKELPGNNSVTFAPEGAYGAVNEQSVFTHGAEVGLARNETHDLETATEELIQSLAQSNPRLSRRSDYSRATIGGRSGLRATLSNVSDATRTNERIAVFTTLLQDGTLFYLIGVSPENEFSVYDPVFRQVVSSIKFTR